MRGLLVCISWFRGMSAEICIIKERSPQRSSMSSHGTGRQRAPLKPCSQRRGTPHALHEALPTSRNKWSPGDRLSSLKNLDRSGYVLIRTPLRTRHFPPHVSMRSPSGSPSARITECGDAAPQRPPLQPLGCLAQPRGLKTTQAFDTASRR